MLVRSHSNNNAICTVIVISPHLDDAVFACGEALAGHPGSTVITVFAGMPRDGDRLTDWDTCCGFVSARQAMEVRRDEDRRALEVLAASPVWLPFCDSQYGDTPGAGEIEAALAATVRDLPRQTVLFPLGLFHSDHALVHGACIAAFADRIAHDALVYEDALYRAMPGLLQERLATLARLGLRATPAPSIAAVAPSGVKAQAVAAYASQLRAFGPDGYADVREPERCWRLEHVADAENADGR